MKKSVISSMFLSLMFLVCGIFYGCGGRYDNLSISAYFSYDTQYSTELENGVVRYANDNVVFDDNKDGSYTFYIQSLSSVTVPLQVEFAGTPDDFNYNASLSFSNEMIVRPSEQSRQTGNGFVRNITFHSAGDTTMNVLSDEGEKATSINIKVVEIASSVNFVKDNYALTKTNGSFIDLSREKALSILPGDSSVLKVNYTFGTKDEDTFAPFSDLELWGYGLNFDKISNKLSVRQESDLTIKKFWIEATYENPLKLLTEDPEQEGAQKDIKTYTQVSVVNEVEKDTFAVYLGSSRADAVEENKILDGNVQNLINNITSLNYVDVVLEIKSNGEKVEFSINDDGKLPVSKPVVFEEDNIEYGDENKNPVYKNASNPEGYKKAVYTYIHVKLVADKKTVENINYPSDGIYNLGFVCNYASYTVEGYPVQKQIGIKIYDLVKQFSINNESVEVGSIVEDKNFKGYYQDLIYMNTADKAEGTSLNVDVFNPAGILREFSLFNLSLYSFDSSKPEGEQFVKITDVPNYFRIQKTVGNSNNKTNTSSTLSENFEKDTTFYIKANETSGKVAINQTYYLVIEAVLPNNEVFVGKDVENQKAKATIQLEVVQGITSVESFDFYSKNYQVDELTGKFTRVDPDNKNEKLLYDASQDKYYKLIDVNLDDEESNRIYMEGELVVEKTNNENPIRFDSAYVAESAIRLDLTSGFNANVIINYLPAGANLQNLKINSSNKSVFEVGTYNYEDGTENLSANAFSIIPKGVGEAEVLISTSNLEQVYKIKVSVYKPITNMFVALSSTLWSDGVGTHSTVNDPKTQNKVVESAVVMVEKSIRLNISTLPIATSEYTMEYSFYEWDGSKYETTAAGSFVREYNGKTSSEFAYLQNDVFTFNCNTNVFAFSKNASQNDKILLVIKLVNLDGTYFERKIELSSFVPVSSIDTTPNRSVTLENPKTVAYELKTDKEGDPTLFALNVTANKNKQQATFDFANYGYIRVLYNGNTESFEVRNGSLVANNSNKILLPISLISDVNGNFFFKLNPEYTYNSTYTTIVLIVEIKEFDNYFSKPIYVYIKNNTLVSSLKTSGETELYFKQGITNNKTVNFDVYSEKADNKTVVAKTFNILQKDNKIYYVEATEQTNNVISPVTLAKTSNNSYSFEVEPKNAGEAVVVLMPQDKIISKAHYDTWNNYSYQTINIETGEFVDNFFYIRENESYTLATSYDANATYFVKAVQTSSYVSIWKDYLAIYTTVADGEKVPYQIASLEDLEDVSKTNDSVTKRYVLVKNLILDTRHNWEPIGNYYVANIAEEDYSAGKYFVNVDESFVLSEAAAFNEDETYYLYGFNGEFNFKYKHVDIKQNVILENSYSILNIAYAGTLNEEDHVYGMFSKLGKNALVEYANISYNFYQPKLSGNFIFGGVAGVNEGRIINAKVEFSNFVFETVAGANIGGIVGVNYGELNNNDTSIVATNGVLKVNVSTTDDEPYKVDIGGLVGYNTSLVSGSFSQVGDMEPVFNDAGFDSSLNIVVDILEGKTSVAETSIGGAVGRNAGFVKNLSIQGSVSAEKLNNVGGLVGTSEYSVAYTEEKPYAIESSYSIAKVVGNDNVGGAVGSVVGAELDKLVKILNISAENYATVFNKNKTFVIGNEYVGGLVGYSSFAEFNYCYAVSYFDNVELKVDTLSVETNYDIIGNNYVGGFVGNTLNTNYVSSSASVYSFARMGEVSVFAGNKDEYSSGSNVFATGTIYSLDNGGMIYGLNLDRISNFAYYSYTSYKTNGDVENLISYFDGSNFVLSGVSVESLISYFNASTEEWKQDWDIDDSEKEQKVNGGLPYLTLNDSALYATVPLLVEAIVIEDNYLTTHIKNDNSSLVLFYNYDYLNAYAEYGDRIQKLNLLSLSQFASLKVFAETYKSYRLDISVSGKGVLEILSDGTIKILGEGSEEIIISSKLNSKYQAKIYVVVKYGVNDINLYSNISFTTNLDDCDNSNRIETLKSRNYNLYSEQSYTRSITENVEDIELSNAKLRSTNDIGVRFKVSKSQIEQILIANPDIKDINELFKFNGLNWQDDGGAESTHLYIDVPKKQNVFITPITAFEQALTIEYVPYLYETFGTKTSTIYLTKFGGDFQFIVKKGATKVMIESNKDNLFNLSQLQTQTFTITLYTDYEDDSLVEDFNALIYDSYNDNNIWDVLNNSEENLQPGQGASDLLTIVRSDIKRSYSDKDNKLLESISMTYTINYKDKVNAVNKDKLFRFDFVAFSDTTVKLSVGIIILGQDKINQVYGTVYSSIPDFPQTPEKYNIIYNGNVGVLALEVYPFFSNYDKLRVRYESDLNYPILMTQLSYDITANTGDKLVQYPYSGSVSDFNEYLWLEKASGQDTYLLNDLGLYSYSKTYFVSLLVSTYLPDDTYYTIYVDILNSKNDIIETYSIQIKTVAQPGIRFGFDERTLGNNSKYYLPLNTVNKLNVETFNYDGDIEWEVECLTGFELTEEMKNVLTPYLDVDGNYYFKVMEYLGKEKNNIFNLNLLGHTLQIKGSIDDGRNAPKFGQNYFTVNVTVSLFTVLDVVVQNVENGYLTLPVSSTTPLYAYVDAYYDKALTDSTDNWYVNIDRTELEEALKACGYEVEDSFSNYITQLQNALSKARYSTEEEGEIKTSGVWFYSTEDGASSYLQSTKSYNSNTFGVELYNDYFSVYGRQIDKNTSLALRLSLAYSNSKKGEDRVEGIPNVLGYNVSPTNTSYETVFNYNKDFILNFVYKSDLINAIPVSTAEEFLSMEAGFDYRLIADIELSGYTPTDTEIATFDGNNHTIFITSFAYNNDVEEPVSLGLFSSTSQNTILYNVSVCYTNRVEVYDQQLQSITNGLLTVGLLKSSAVTFGGITATNNGTLTNCKVTGSITINLNADVNAGVIGTGINGGLVAVNSSTGYITNSKVQNFNLSCYGSTGGVVEQNDGKIVATYLDSSSINNMSSDATGGFVHTNKGEIYECFAQGYRLSTDNDIRNTGNGISSKGIVAGFVYSNSNLINDCYSNIKLSSSRYIAGFIHQDDNNSIISRCYSICYKERNDNSIVASPFFGTNDITKITVNGELNNCYFLKGTGTWIDNGTFVNNEQNKVPVGLSFDEFATHTSFTNYDLSLTYKSAKYADGRIYNYVDGYTWVIIEGKPLLVSSLVDTISERRYEGKNKKYSDNFNLFTAPASTNGENDNSVVVNEVMGGLGENKKKYYYYKNLDADGRPYTNEENAKVPENLLYVVVVDYTQKTMTYTFEAKEVEGNKKSELLTLVYSIELSATNEILSKKVLYADYGEENKAILDVREETADGFINDDNYRANDTIVVKYKGGLDNKQILSIDYYILESASYYYSTAVNGKSFGSGTRTNPQMVYDYNSFSTYLSSNTKSNFFRLIKDIDFEYNFTKTSYSNFQGALQGSYMTLSRLSISYISNVENNKGEKVEEENKNSFGLFAKISTIENSDYTEFTTTIISNLKIDVVEVLSNTHSYVGGLAGQINAYGKGDMSRNVILNNINIKGYNDNRAFIQGRNAVGGLIGYATGNVIIKDITSSVSVNATKEMDVGSDAKTMLYYNQDNTDKDISYVSYAGGVVGIFDASEIFDYSTHKNYNANNISVSGDVTVIGGVAGGAFGLVAVKTIVNYVNVLVKTSDRNFVKALSYAGGIVGENRGTIISSSITYGILESYSSVQPGESSLINTNFFYNGGSGNTVIAIGGIAGLNNGGTISNSISTVDVRNVNALIAGGAVGRFIQGNMENVIASGSVMANTIIGGLVGTLNDRKIVEEAGYSENAIVELSMFDKKLDSSIYGNNVRSVFNNNVSANNWLIQDYSTYIEMINDNKIVGGYIGLISNTSVSHDKKLEFVSFKGKSYYSNTLYTSRTSQNAKSYLKAAYSSNSFDNSSLIEQEVIDVLTNSSGQAVFPYSTREMYYENTLIGPYYTMSSLANYPDYKEQKENPYVKFIYEIIESSGITNINSLYEQIDLTDTNIWLPEEIDKVLLMTDTLAYNWLKSHFGNIFEYKDNEYKIVTQISNSNRTGKKYNYYYLPTDDLKIIETKVTYSAEENDIVPYNVDITYDGSKYTVNNLKAFVLNGNLIASDQIVFNDSTNLSFDLQDKVAIELGNGVVVSDISFEAQHTENDKNGNPIFVIKSLTISYSYNTTKEYISKVINSTGQVNNDEHRLSVTSKKVIYKSFINNGYWLVGDNFFLNNDYANATKYLTNLENAEVYVWEEFKKTYEGSEIDKITQDFGDKITISTPEEFALFAHYVNEGQTYENKTVTLASDIDLSGKYWKPIGIDSAHPFMGKFDGKYQDEAGNEKIATIKYATVNDKLYDGSKIPDYAGIFGYVNNATFMNLVVNGGDIEGKFAGGLVGYGIGEVNFENVVNRNTVVGLESAGGIIGQSDNKCVFIDVANYGEVSVKESYSYNVNVGGLVGCAKYELTLGKDEAESTVVNYGNLNVFNLINSYSQAYDYEKVGKVNAGGIVGYSSNVTNFTEVVNRGNIHITTNAHFLNVGGVIGLNGPKTSTLKNLKNYGNIEINYNNGIVQNTSNTAAAFVGGIAGKTENNIIYSGNEGTISFTISTTTYAYIGIGGVVGSTNGDVSTSYNSNNINILTISSRTSVGVGGIVGLINSTMDGANPNNHTITDCYNSGDIFCDGNSFMFVGGILGSAYIIGQVNKNIIMFTQDSIFKEVLSINTVKNCLNIGYVNITSFKSSQNGLGAIAGINTFLKQKSNYYIIDSAYSGSDIFTSVCAVDEEAGESNLKFKAVVDGDTNYNEIIDGFDTLILGAIAKRTVSLKSLENSYVGWNFNGDDSTWLQSYDTWYPTLRGNESSSLWEDKQDVVSQEKGSYVVRNAEQFAYIASKINNGEIDSNGITIKLGNSIDLSNRFWTPIGTKENPFRGTFDGNNYVVRNLTIDGKVLDKEYLKSFNYGALFGYVSDATIMNVGMESAIVHNVKYAASIACFVDNSRIEKVYSDAGNSKNSKIIAFDTFFDNNENASTTLGAGGLVYSMTNCSPAELNNMRAGLYYSYNNIPVEFGVKAASQYNAISYIGGLVASLKNSVINNSYNNTDGIVSLTTDKSNEEQNEMIGYLISGNVDNQSSLFNVFNLSKISFSGAEKTANSLFAIIHDQATGRTFIKPTNVEPTFDNLDDSGEVKLKDIWTNEYSLNEETASAYPFLRGLGKEWKNTESEGLKSYSYNNDETGNLEYQLLNGVLPQDKDNKTMFKIENPTLPYVQNSAKKVYLISSSEDLAWLATNVNNGSLTTTNCEFILIKDINLTGKYWTPIGVTSVYPFQGVFNFNGHVISGLTIDSNTLAYGGLFGYTSNAYICNGYIKNAFIKLASDNATTNIYVGTVVGKGYNTTIENVSVTTNLAAFSNSATFVGGIIGSLTGTNDYVISNVMVNNTKKTYEVGGNKQIIDSYIDTSIIEPYITELGQNGFKSGLVSIAAYSTGGNVYCGGIAGYMSGYQVSDVNSEYLLNNATNNVNIAAVSESYSSDVFLGGILGHGLEEVTLNIVSNYGDLKSYSNQYDVLGGIVGYLYNGSVNNAYFGGYIEGTQEVYIRTYLGGIIGQLETAGSVRYVVNAGSINSNADYHKNATVGGIIGQTKDHLFTQDYMGVFNSSDYGFATAVGFADYREGFIVSEIEKDFEAVFSPTISSFNTNEAIGCWKISNEVLSLVTNHIYLSGCQTSFGCLTNNNLSNRGELISSLDIEIRYTSGGYEPTDKIGFGIVDKNFNYFYIETETTGNNFVLQDVLRAAIESYNNNQENVLKIEIINGSTIDSSLLSTLYVTMVKVEDNA